MKNKYIKEMNSIHASDSFKEEMIEKMVAQSNQSNVFSFNITKLALVVSCVCLCVVSALSIKNYYDMQTLKEELIGTKQLVNKILCHVNEFDRLMDRNYVVNNEENPMNPSYSNPFVSGMGGSDIFPGITAKSDEELVQETDISLVNFKQLDKIQIIQMKESVINHKDKIDLLNEMVEFYGKDDYNFIKNKDNYVIVTEKFTITILNTSIELKIKESEYPISNNEDEMLDTIKKMIQDYSMIFNSKKYNIELEKNEGENLAYSIRVSEYSSNFFENWLNRKFKYISIVLEEGYDHYISIKNEESNRNEEYPIVSYEEALSKVNTNESYAISGVKQYLNYDRVANVTLNYFYDHKSNYFLPYYEFFLEVDYELCREANFIIEEDKKTYGSIYVPAISDEYIETYYDVTIDIATSEEDYVDPNHSSVVNGDYFGFAQ